METPVSDEVQDVLLHVDMEACDLVHFHRVADIEAGEIAGGMIFDAYHGGDPNILPPEGVGLGA